MKTKIKTYIVYVSVDITLPPSKHEPQQYTWLTQYTIKAKNKQSATANGAKKVIKDAKKREPNAAKVKIRNVECLDMTGKLK